MSTAPNFLLDLLFYSSIREFLKKSSQFIIRLIEKHIDKEAILLLLLSPKIQFFLEGDTLFSDFFIKRATENGCHILAACYAFKYFNLDKTKKADTFLMTAISPKSAHLPLLPFLIFKHLPFKYIFPAEFKTHNITTAVLVTTAKFELLKRMRAEIVIEDPNNPHPASKDNDDSEEDDRFNLAVPRIDLKLDYVIKLHLTYLKLENAEKCYLMLFTFLNEKTNSFLAKSNPLYLEYKKWYTAFDRLNNAILFITDSKSTLNSFFDLGKYYLEWAKTAIEEGRIEDAKKHKDSAFHCFRSVNIHDKQFSAALSMALAIAKDDPTQKEEQTALEAQIWILAHKPSPPRIFGPSQGSTHAAFFLRSSDPALEGNMNRENKIKQNNLYTV